MKTNKKTKPKQYDKFLGISAPMWAFLCLAIFMIACVSELSVRSETKRKIAFIEHSYDSLSEINDSITARYTDMFDTFVKVVRTQRVQLADQRWKIKELKERSDFYCDAYQSCMIAFEKYVGEKNSQNIKENK